MTRILFSLLVISIVCSPLNQTTLRGAEKPEVPENFSKGRLVAWCIVPFDAKNRTPAQRALMVKELGLTRVAYDWRAKHVPEFEEEIRQYQKNNIEFFAFWSWHDSLAPLIKKYDIHPQIWITLPSPNAPTQQDKIQAAAKQLLPLAHKAKELGCQLGLYNHGGWGGEPENLVAVCEFLRKEHSLDNVGIVYNFHHGHEHIKEFPRLFKTMQPYLLCLNLNGMVAAEHVDGLKNKIVPIGDGKYESSMIETVINSGYDGPIGLLDHRNELDAKESLQQNIDGLKNVLMNRK